MKKWSSKKMAAVDVERYLNASRFIAESLYISPVEDGFVLVTFLNKEDLPCEHYVQNGECVHCRLALEDKDE